jgi:ABC-type multidrug transport system permease subunit
MKLQRYIRGRGHWFLVSGFWFLVSGFWFLVSGFWFLVSGFWFLVSGFWFLVILKKAGKNTGQPASPQSTRPLHFVHGVSTRNQQLETRNQKLRNAAFF